MAARQRFWALIGREGGGRDVITIENICGGDVRRFRSLASFTRYVATNRPPYGLWRVTGDGLDGLSDGELAIVANNAYLALRHRRHLAGWRNPRRLRRRDWESLAYDLAHRAPRG